MERWTLGLIVLLGLGCGGDPWERRLQCRELEAASEKCLEYKTLDEALDEVSTDHERRKLVALFKLFGPTPAPMCKGIAVEEWGWWKKRKLKKCQRVLEKFP